MPGDVDHHAEHAELLDAERLDQQQHERGRGAYQRRTRARAFAAARSGSRTSRRSIAKKPIRPNTGTGIGHRADDQVAEPARPDCRAARSRAAERRRRPGVVEEQSRARGQSYQREQAKQRYPENRSHASAFRIVRGARSLDSFVLSGLRPWRLRFLRRGCAAALPLSCHSSGVRTGRLFFPIAPPAAPIALERAQCGLRRNAAAVSRAAQHGDVLDRHDHAIAELDLVARAHADRAELVLGRLVAIGTERLPAHQHVDERLVEA